MYLGKKVKFIANRPSFEMKDGQRIQKGNSIVEGEGLIRAICLDHTKRKIVQLQNLNDPSDVFNADFNCIDPDPQFKEKFKYLVETIAQLGKEGNDKAKDIISEYNAAIEKVSDEILGNRVEFL